MKRSNGWILGVLVGGTLLGSTLMDGALLAQSPTGPNAGEPSTGSSSTGSSSAGSSSAGSSGSGASGPTTGAPEGEEEGRNEQGPPDRPVDPGGDPVVHPGGTTTGGPPPADDQPTEIPCPGVGLEYIEATVSYSGRVPCGSDIDLTVGGVTYTQGERGCPMYATINPAHTRVVPDPGSGMKAKHANFESAKAIRFGCEFSYFLFIEWNHRCEELNIRHAGAFPTFTLVPCGEVSL